MSDPLPIRDDLVLPGADLSWSAARSGGPGGQHVNKTASKVDLRFDLEACEVLPPAVKARLRRLAAGRLDAEGRIQVVRGEHRDQPRNLEAAREALRQLVLQALAPPKRRRPTRPTRGSKERRLSQKRKQGEKKQGRKPPYD